MTEIKIILLITLVCFSLQSDIYDNMAQGEFCLDDTDCNPDGYTNVCCGYFLQEVGNLTSSSYFLCISDESLAQYNIDYSNAGVFISYCVGSGNSSGTTGTTGFSEGVTTNILGTDLSYYYNGMVQSDDTNWVNPNQMLPPPPARVRDYADYYWYPPPVHSNYYSEQVYPAASSYYNPYNAPLLEEVSRFKGYCDPFNKYSCKDVSSQHCCGTYAVSGELMYALSILKGSDASNEAVEKALQTFTCGLNPAYQQRPTIMNMVEYQQSSYWVPASRYSQYDDYSNNYHYKIVDSPSFYCANDPQLDRSCDLDKKLDCAARHGFFYCCAKYALTNHGRYYLEEIYIDDDMGYIEDYVDDYEYTCEIDPYYFDAQEWQAKTDGIFTYTCSFGYPQFTLFSSFFLALYCLF